MTTIHAPELRATGERYVSTSTGIGIGRCYVRQPLARVAGCISGPHRRPGIAARLLGVVGSMRALWVLIGICAAALLAKPARRASDGWAFWLILTACVLVFVLLSACTGPSEAEAAADTAADLQEAPLQARAEIHQAQALALLSARGHK